MPVCGWCAIGRGVPSVVVVNGKFVVAGSVCQFGVRHKFVCSGESTPAAGGRPLLVLVPSHSQRNHVGLAEKGGGGAAP